MGVDFFVNGAAVFFHFGNELLLAQILSFSCFCQTATKFNMMLLDQ